MTQEALAQAEQKPVAWMYVCNGDEAHPVLVHTQKDWAKSSWWNEIPLYTSSPQRTWADLTDEQLRTEFGKLYPNDIGILELAENNRDFAVEAIGARHHWVAFQAGARAAEAKLKELNT